MIETPNSNITLTFEQMAQIEETKNRLKNLENEIIIATKNLGILNKDIVKAIKEKEFQEELIVKISEDVKVKEDEKKSIENSVLEIEKYSKKVNEDAVKLQNLSLQKEAELTERESNLVESEKKHQKDLEEFKVFSNELKKDREKVEITVQAFNNAIQTWK